MNLVYAYDTYYCRICKNLVTRRVTTSDGCKINLITTAKLSNIDNVCKVKYTSIKHGIFHKLMSANSLFYFIFLATFIYSLIKYVLVNHYTNLWYRNYIS